MNLADTENVMVDLARISGVSMRLCDAQLATVSLSGDDAPLPVFRELPTTRHRIERAITTQGDFLAVGIFSEEHLQGYLIAGT